MPRTTIVLADDHTVVRQGLRALLEAVPDFAVLGEVAGGPEVVALVERLRPDVLVLDLMMPGLSGLEVTRRLRQRCPRTRVVILSMHADEVYVLQALRNGAVGYVLKESGAAEVVQAVREAAAGRRFLSPPLSEEALESFEERTRCESLDLYDALTSREREVLQLVAEGLKSGEIAARLGISARAAETHRANLMRKLDLPGQAAVIRYAIQRGILPPVQRPEDF